MRPGQYTQKRYNDRKKSKILERRTDAQRLLGFYFCRILLGVDNFFHKLFVAIASSIAARLPVGDNILPVLLICRHANFEFVILIGTGRVHVGRPGRTIRTYLTQVLGLNWLSHWSSVRQFVNPKLPCNPCVLNLHVARN